MLSGRLYDSFFIQPRGVRSHPSGSLVCQEVTLTKKAARQRVMTAMAIVSVAAASTARAAVEAGTPRGVATAVERITVDGVLDDKEWAWATPIGPLVQRDPVEGAA